MTLLLFVLILSILILVHEGGHFWAARRMGVRVEEFALGFGPKLFSWTKGDTKYCLCAIPLGGFVKMAGDERDHCVGAKDEYFSKSLGARALIVLMGPVVNYVLAFLCFSAVFMMGYVDLEATGKNRPAIIGEIMSGTPAEEAEFVIGDQIYKVDNVEVTNWMEMQEEISNAGNRALRIDVKRDALNVTVLVVPEYHKTKDLFGREREASVIGIKPQKVGDLDDLVVRKYGFFASFQEGAKELWKITVRTYGALWEIVTGQRSAKEGVTGLVGIFFIIKFAAAIGFSFLLHVFGVISASLAIFNLLPLIPLDGGHLFFIIIEKIRGRAMSEKTDILIGKAGLVFMVTLALFVFWIDFERIGLIDKLMGFFR